MVNFGGEEFTVEEFEEVLGIIEEMNPKLALAVEGYAHYIYD